MRVVLAILIGLGLIVLVFVLILKGFSGSGSSPNTQIDLKSYADTNAVAQLILDAPIYSDSKHRTVKVTVSQNQTEIDIIQGYQGNVIETKTYPNNAAAYAVFLRALAHQNFTSGNTDSSQRDERGWCPQGDRYIYSFSSGGNDLMRFWSTSCGQGTFKGNAGMVRWIFEQQIPDYGTLTENIPGLID